MDLREGLFTHVRSSELRVLISVQPAARQEGATSLQRQSVVLRRLHQPRRSAQAAQTSQRQARARRVRRPRHQVRSTRQGIPNLLTHSLSLSLVSANCTTAEMYL